MPAAVGRSSRIEEPRCVPDGRTTQEVYMSGQFVQQYPLGALPASAQGIGTFPGPFHSQAFAQPSVPYPFGNAAGFGGYGAALLQPPPQQIVQSLLIVPQQLQHLLQLAQIQQHQVQYLLQSIPQQLQQLQQQLAHQPALQPFTPHQGWGVQQIPPGFSQPFGAQPGYVM
jgi:hypothetical protein